MHTPYPIALIGPQHYRVFQDILGPALPASYDEWLARHAIEKLEQARSGREVQEIRISPDELIRYGNAHSTAPDAGLLRQLALEKAGERQA